MNKWIIAAMAILVGGVSSSASAQPFHINYQVEGNLSSPWSIIATVDSFGVPDGGTLEVGSSALHTAVAMRLDPAGTVLWAVDFGPGFFTGALQVNGDFIFVGLHSVGMIDQVPWVVRYGSTNWATDLSTLDNTGAAADRSDAQAVALANDGNVLVVGGGCDNNDVNCAPWITKVAFATGGVMWGTTLLATGGGVFYDVRTVAGGNIVALGSGQIGGVGARRRGGDEHHCPQPLMAIRRTRARG